MLDLNDALEFAGRLADAGGDLVRSAFREPLDLQIKDGISPVTETDKAVEQCVRQLVNDRYPEHGILGEEYGSEELDREYVWIIDPIDGTKQFIAGLQTFGTLIALAKDGAPILGLIDQPVTGDRWTGAHGLPTRHNGRPIFARSCERLCDAVLSTTAADSFRGDAQTVYQDLNQQTQWTVYGGGCLAYGSLASGMLDVLIEARNDPYDYCAHVPIVYGAGGVITDWEGKPLTIHSGDQVLATGDTRLHEQALTRIEGLA